MSEFESVDGLSYAEIKVTAPDGPWPAMVMFEPDDFSSLLPDDARRLAHLLVQAAGEADGMMVEPREGMVTVYDEHGVYVGCMGYETWRRILAVDWNKLGDTQAAESILRHALTRIAEGNLGDHPWQANYDRIYDIAREALLEARRSAAEEQK